jgi:hypothetical protein
MRAVFLRRSKTDSGAAFAAALGLALPAATALPLIAQKKRRCPKKKDYFS